MDAHLHYWRLARGDYAWLTAKQGSLFRDFEPEDLREQLARCGVCATVLVQAAASEAETRFLFELAHRHESIAGVVGWVEFEAADVGARIRALAQQSAGKLKGLRPMVQDIADPTWLQRPALDAAFEALINEDLAFDALVLSRHLVVLRERLQKHPRLKAVLDHACKPDIAGREFETWATEISELARSTSAYCKLSGLLTQTAPDAGSVELNASTIGLDVGAAAINQYVAHVFACFGAGRVMWGSDWPVVTTRASYQHWFELALALVRRHAPGAEQAVFRDNAIRFYGLDVGEGAS